MADLDQLLGTDPLNIQQGQPYKGWKETVLPVYEEHRITFAVIAALYLPVIFGLAPVMDFFFPGDARTNEAHKSFDRWVLKLPLILWNLALAGFSMWGAFHLLPEILSMTQLNTLDIGILRGTLPKAICDNSCYDKSVSIVVLYFNLSKMPEFVDTIFLRLRKRPVIFLHWYHHIVTMLYCWYANQVGYKFNCSGMFFAGMNLLVHSFMYTYYALAAAGFRKTMNKLNLNVLLTAGQITQMVGGIFILAISTTCEDFDTVGFTIATVMYTSYLLLFSQLFWGKYRARFTKWFGVDKASADKKSN